VHKLPPGCEKVVGNALDARSYLNYIDPATVFIHLIGVAHPSPFKKINFRQIDLASVQEATIAATKAGIGTFYL